jgi:hypothetical protein
MPRFYFNLQDNLYREDQDGAEFPDLAAVRAHAFHYAMVLTSASVAERGSVTLSDSIVVTDDAGHLLFVVRLEDVVKVPYGRSD